MVEEWRNVNEWYQVSNLGRARSIDHYVKNGNGDRIVRGRILKASAKDNGYLIVKVGGKGVQYLHRLIATAFIDNPDNKREVNHKDFDKNNNAVDNLEWMTAKENTIHYFHTTKKPRPGITGKLILKQAQKIKQLISEDVDCKKIAVLYGVTVGTIYHIKNEHTWRHA